MKTIVYDSVQAIMLRGINDLGKVQAKVANVAAWMLGRIDNKRLNYEVACVEQGDDLEELKVLTSTLDIKKKALRDGGFDVEHGPLLALAANTLVEEHAWEDEDVMSWFGPLVMDEEGENLGADIYLEDEEE